MADRIGVREIRSMQVQEWHESEDRRLLRLLAEEYHENHVLCPACGSKDLRVTTVGYIRLDDRPVVDRNRANCHACGWVGIIDDLKPRDGGQPLA